MRPIRCFLVAELSTIAKICAGTSSWLIEQQTHARLRRQDSIRMNTHKSIRLLQHKNLRTCNHVGKMLRLSLHFANFLLKVFVRIYSLVLFQSVQQTHIPIHFYFTESWFCFVWGHVVLALWLGSPSSTCTNTTILYSHFAPDPWNLVWVHLEMFSLLLRHNICLCIEIFFPLHLHET